MVDRVRGSWILLSVIPAVFVLAMTGCGRSSNSATGGSSRSPRQVRFERNRVAFLAARNASDPAVAPTFREARYILAETIDPGHVTDPDLREYIDSMRRVAEVCIEVGIGRGADPKPLKLLVAIDPGSATQAVLAKGLTRATEQAQRLTGELTGLRAGMGRIEELDGTLSRRYRR